MESQVSLALAETHNFSKDKSNPNLGNIQLLRKFNQFIFIVFDGKSPIHLLRFLRKMSGLRKLSSFITQIYFLGRKRCSELAYKGHSVFEMPQVSKKMKKKMVKEEAWCVGRGLATRLNQQRTAKRKIAEDKVEQEKSFSTFLTMHSEEEEDCSGALYRITSSIAAAKRKGENLSRA